MRRNHLSNKLILLMLLGLFSCESLVDNMNTDLNNPTDASATLLLTAAELGNVSVQEGHLARVASMWSGYFTGSDRQYKDIYNYNVTGASFNDVWQFVYQSVVEQTQLIIEKSEASNNRLMQGIAKVITANALGTATACWGDIPFSEAADIEKFPNPAFESQTVVYGKLQALLDEAIADLESGAGTSPGVADIHFGGDSDKWKMAAYSLKARFFMETKEYALAAAAAEKGINAPGASWVMYHGNTLNVNENLMYAYIARNRVGDVDASLALVPNLLNPGSATYKGNAKTDETARYKYQYMTVNASGSAIPVTPNTSSTTTARGLFGQTTSYPMVSYSETLLTAAEAAARTKGFDEGLAKLNLYRAYLNGGGDLDATYKSAYTFKYEPYVEADFEPGGMLNPDNMSAQSALLKEILMERYVSFNGQIIGFNDLRRTRNEAEGVQLQPATGSSLPERMIYSEAEINSNTSAPNPVPGLFVPTAVNL
ncbi:SusD-like starch-binding protein associating with outer membrane [Dyadobacter jejuensis]|uniref:SusD-like starch-binding protein associating with outer membrane n=1 Tax=Dyadobacter jejuensis TaxID=1082580 RepID=A0A316AAT9_9BACT|nr:SusD/RagB family nutrient-binding outer membrane lipoprotein [Dyadobacter jejuensis]PWJ54741.1 SusD-like starch-binding protein associating with outer membrane [Dyadobacter jejuensis]